VQPGQIQRSAVGESPLLTDSDSITPEAKIGLIDRVKEKIFSSLQQPQS
jgi:hypothetical protein